MLNVTELYAINETRLIVTHVPLGHFELSCVFVDHLKAQGGRGGGTFPWNRTGLWNRRRVWNRCVMY